MKVRIGISPGRTGLDLDGIDSISTAILESGFDSLWLSEVLTSDGIDPLIGLAVTAARHDRLKIGTTMLAPGRNPVRLAKMLATLDRLSGGRLLVTFVPGLTTSPESDAIGASPEGRGPAMDELLPLLRRLLDGETVEYEGVLGAFGPLSLHPTPLQQPLEFWLGGMVRASLVRCGKLADGWLPSLCSTERAVKGREVINAAAAEVGREISPEHFGVSVPYAIRRDDSVDRSLASRRVARDDTAPPVGAAAIRASLEAFIEVGFSKFVLRPLGTPRDWKSELVELSGIVGDLQS